MSDLTVRTEVVRERGQWAVYLLVIDLEGISRRRLSVHRSEREAQVTASSVQRGANRRQRPVPEGRPVEPTPGWEDVE